MFIDQHPYLSIYFLGSLLVIPLTFIKIGLFYMIDWIIKANILKKNLKKLAEPDDKAWYQRIMIFLGILIIEVALSWINVVVILGQTIYGIVKVLREMFTPTPEEIKVLRFPLRNNPMLSKEAVWAYLMAINVKVGEAVQKENAVVASIEDVLYNRPDFNYRDALDQLDNLKVMNSEIISSAKVFLAAENNTQQLDVWPVDNSVLGENEDSWELSEDEEGQFIQEKKILTSSNRFATIVGGFLVASVCFLILAILVGSLFFDNRSEASLNAKIGLVLVTALFAWLTFFYTRMTYRGLRNHDEESVLGDSGKPS